MMTLPGRIAAATLLAAVASVAAADPTDYVFDSVSRFDLAKASISVTGVLSNTTTPTTITFADAVSAKDAVNRCVPVFLTMIEKPGRYYLNLTIDPADTAQAIISCGLELRN
jgi:hypothetical protein